MSISIYDQGSLRRDLHSVASNGSAYCAGALRIEDAFDKLARLSDPNLYGRLADLQVALEEATARSEALAKRLTELASEHALCRFEPHEPFKVKCRTARANEPAPTSTTAYREEDHDAR